MVGLSRGEGISVLLVDDEPGFLDLAKEFIETGEKDFIVYTASSAEEGIELLREHEFDCIVSDYQMPGMDGLDFLDFVRNELNLDIPFIMFTGKGREEVAMNALNLGADRYLQKGGAPKSQYEVLAEAIKQEYESYKTEIELERSEREKKLILDSTSDLIAYLDTEMNILWANKAAARSVDRKPGEIEGCKCYEVWHGREDPCQRCPVLKALDTGKKHQGEVESPDGRYWLISANPVKNSDGEVIGVVEATQDITDLKVVIKKLEESKKEYKSVLDSMNESIWLIDLKGNIIEVNETAVEKLGYSRDELLSMGTSQIDGSLSKIEVKDKLNKVIEEGADVFETTHKNSDGEIIPVEVSLSLINYRGDKAVLSVVRDISDRIKTQKQLKERVKELNLLYRLSKLEEDVESLDEFLGNAVELLPPSFRYPGNAEAKIVYNDNEFLSSDYRDGDYYLRNDIFVSGEKKGFVEICYPSEQAWMKGDVFLDEEKQLFNEFTNRIGSILEKKKTKKQLERSEERYRRLFETAQDGMLIIDAETGEIKDANPYIQELLNYNKSDLVGKKLWELGREKDIEENKKRYQKLVDERYIRYEDLPLESKYGDEVYVEFVSNTYSVGEKKVIQCNIRDITERKQVEKQFKSFVENAPDGILVHNLEGDIILANEKASNLLGYTKKELQEMKTRDIDPVFHDKYPFKEFWNQVTTGKSRTIETEHRCKDGSTYPVRVSLRKIKIDNEDAVLAFFRDITEMKKARESLKKSRKRLKRSQEIAKVGSWELDLTNNKIELSEQASKIFEINSNVDLKYQDFLNYVHPEDREYVESRGQEALETGYYDIEHRLLINGEVKWVHEKAFIEYNDLEPNSVFGTIQDITDSKKLEERLKEYKRAVQGSTDLMAAVNLDKEYIFANKKYLKFLDIDKQENLVGKKLNQVYSGKELQKITKNINKALNGETIQYEMKRGKKDEKYFDIRYYPLRRKNSVKGVVAVLRDITKRKEIEKDLKTKEKAINSSTNAISIIGPEGRYTYVNPAWTELFGYEKKEAIDKNQTELIDNQDIKQKINEIHQKVIEKGDWREETKIEAKNRELWVEIASSTIETKKGSVIGYINSYKDITTRKKAEERREFLHTLLRHDVRNKLQLIRGYHDLIREQKLPKTTKKYLDKSEQAIEDSIDITKKIKILNKLEEKTRIQEIELNKVLEKVVRQQKPHAKQKNIEIKYTPNRQKVYGGPLLNELFSNLLENSIRHSSCNLIQIKTTTQKNKYIITIEDDGVGLPTTDKELFEKGFKKGGEAGSGLGLYFAKKITNRYNGSIEPGESKMGGAKIEVHLEKPT
ncbi:PAS domain S-box protein [Methanonatronarchaeum sp. AMET-Sl]|uniref:PAS domain S-box protein n=1 Tax=Methanonatronarchaeum sp. AMET-Sl TaxID=3037654 RepID=UPI00244E591B|nr:PAS domain S-box protein [Methanonatronarchaeum sp. AMET-Sl]WGI16927.1 PAS domain S-box protein [Methanonatronarchaeum sp. AMET-Sl]